MAVLRVSGGARGHGMHAPRKREHRRSFVLRSVFAPSFPYPRPAARGAEPAYLLSASATPALATAFCTWDALMSAFRASADMVFQISLLTKGTWSAAQLLGRKYLSNLSFSLSSDSFRRNDCSRYSRASQQRHRPFFFPRLDLCLDH